MKIKRAAILLSKLLTLALVLVVLLSFHSKSFAAPNPYGSDGPYGTGVPSDIASNIITYAGDDCSAWPAGTLGPGTPAGPFEGAYVSTWISRAGQPGVDFSADTIAPNQQVSLQINTMVYICPANNYSTLSGGYYGSGSGVNYLPPDGYENTSVFDLSAVTFQFNSLTVTGSNSATAIGGFSDNTQESVINPGNSVYWFTDPVSFTYTAPSTTGTQTITETGPVVNLFGSNPTNWDCDAQVGNPPEVVATTEQDWNTTGKSDSCGDLTYQYTVDVAEYNNQPTLTNTPDGGSVANPTTIQRPTTSNTSASTITFAVGMNNNGNASGPSTYLEFMNPNTNNYISPGISSTTTTSYSKDPYNDDSYGYDNDTMYDGQGANYHYYFGRTLYPASPNGDVQYQGVQYQVAYRAPGGENCFQSAVTPSTPSDPDPPQNTLLTVTPDCFTIPPPRSIHKPTVMAAADCNVPDVSGTADDADWPTSNPGYSQAPLVVDYSIDGGPIETVKTGSSNDVFSIPMNTYNGSSVDQLLSHTVSISVSDVDSIGDASTTYPAATATVTYPPCYAPRCVPPTLIVPGEANGQQDGPIPNQTFETKGSISFNPTSGQPGNSGSDEASGTYTPMYGNIYLDFETLTGPQTGGATTSYTYTWTNGVPNPGVYTYDTGYTDGAGSTGPCTSTVVVGYHPFVSVEGGDVLSGSGGYSSTSTPGQSCSQASSSSTSVSGAGILAFNDGQPTTSNNGAGTDLASYAPNIINEFASSSGVSPPGVSNPFTNSAPGIVPGMPNGLVFANTYVNPPTTSDPFNQNLYGGGFGNTVPASCASDYYDSHPTTATDVGTTPVSISSLTSPDANGCTQSTDASGVVTTVCYLTSSGGYVDLSGGTNLTGKTIIYVEGDVLLSGNTTLSSGPWSTVDSVPSLYVVTNANMYIDSNVNTLSGVYAAQPPSNSTDEGDIFTCTNGYAMYSASQLFDNCGADTTGPQLVINGAFVANQVRFERTYGSVDQGSVTTSNTTTTTIPSFSTTADWQINGDAKASGNTINLTPVKQNQTGTVFYKTPIPMNENTIITVNFSELMSGGTGADGTSLILAQSPTSLGNYGCSDGLGGINSPGNPAVGLSLDGYQNSPQDPSNSFIGISAAASSPFTVAGAGSCLMNWIVAQKTSGTFTLQGKAVNVSVTITSTTLTATITQGLIIYPIGPVTLSEQPSVYLGFGGSTGNNTDTHSVTLSAGSNYQTTTSTTTPGANEPAELFNYGPMTWLSEPSTSTGGLSPNPDYQSITALAPVL